jgi:hypothetical protein
VKVCGDMKRSDMSGVDRNYWNSRMCTIRFAVQNDSLRVKFQGRAL